eukprot:1797711-Rhodomonas_salina.2
MLELAHGDCVGAGAGGGGVLCVVPRCGAGAVVLTPCGAAPRSPPAASSRRLHGWSLRSVALPLCTA